MSEHKRRHLAPKLKEGEKPDGGGKLLFCSCGKSFKTERALNWHKEETHEKVTYLLARIKGKLPALSKGYRERLAGLATNSIFSVSFW